MKKYVTFFVSMLLLLGFSGCENEKMTEEGGAIGYVICWKVELINHSDMEIGYRSQKVAIGVNLLENKDKIFMDEEEYNSYLASLDLHKIDPDEFFLYEQTKEKVPPNGVLHFREYLGCFEEINPDSILLELDFGNGIYRRLAGWPKYYYSKLEDVVEYGFFYAFLNYDKKQWNYRIDRFPSVFPYFSIDSDDDSGELTGYFLREKLTVRITVNSPDDIRLEIERKPIE